MKPNYQQLIQQTFSERRARNPAYSLRAYARDLGLSASHLSAILHGKEGISRSKAVLLSQALGLSNSEKRWFIDAADAHTARSLKLREAAKARLEKMKKADFLEVDNKKFSLISDWYHLAVLECIELLNEQRKRVDHKTIAAYLGLHETEIARSLELLASLNLIKVRQDVIERVAANVEAPTRHADGAMRHFHQQMLEKAKHAAANQSPTRRALNTLVLSFAKNRAQEADRVINDFCRQFNEQFARESSKDAVYCLAIQFFELNQNGKGL